MPESKVFLRHIYKRYFNIVDFNEMQRDQQI